MLLQAALWTAAALLLLALRPPPPLPAGVPHVKGLPLLGSLLSFARSSTGFLRRHSAALGSSWAAHLLRGPCLFLTNPRDFAGVWRQTEALSFYKIALDVNRTTLGVAEVAALAAVDETTHALWTRHLSGPALPGLTAGFARELLREASGEAGSVLAVEEAAGGWRSVQLYDVVYRLLFAAAARVVVSSELGDSSLLQPFRDFDSAFPLLAAGCPAALAPASALAGRARISQAMLDCMRREAAGEPPASALPRLSPLAAARIAHFRSLGVSEPDCATLNGLLLWPLHANSAPAAFWSIAHLLAAGGDGLAAAVAEADTFRAARPNFPDGEPLSPALLDQALPRLTAACWEALRLSSSSFGVRFATEQTELALAAEGGAPPRTARLQPGVRVFMVPAHHGSEQHFERAAEFRPERFLEGGGASAADVVAFGGGVSKCPGRHFALAELRLLLVVLLSGWEWELPQGAKLPPLHEQRAGLGILPPLRDMPARMRRRHAPG